MSFSLFDWSNFNSYRSSKNVLSVGIETWENDGSWRWTIERGCNYGIRSCVWSWKRNRSSMRSYSSIGAIFDSKTIFITFYCSVNYFMDDIKIFIMDYWLKLRRSTQIYWVDSLKAWWSWTNCLRSCLFCFSCSIRRGKRMRNSICHQNHSVNIWVSKFL